MNEKNKPCPCGLNADYEKCCGRFIGGRALPEHPEELMRSRYTAFTLADMRYLRNTMKDKALKNFDSESAGAWAQRVDWLGLDVMNSQETGNRGVVEFCARFADGDQPGEIHEVSQFYRVGKKWYYTGQ